MAEKIQKTEQGRSHQQTEDQNDMQDAEVVQEVEENVNVQAENKTKGKNEIQAGI